jgi:hypothetical protein
MVPKGSRNFSKQFGRGIKMERKRENGLMQKRYELEIFFLLSQNIHPLFMRLLELFSFYFSPFLALSLYFETD